MGEKDEHKPDCCPYCDSEDIESMESKLIGGYYLCKDCNYILATRDGVKR